MIYLAQEMEKILEFSMFGIDLTEQSRKLVAVRNGTLWVDLSKLNDFIHVKVLTISLRYCRMLNFWFSLMGGKVGNDRIIVMSYSFLFVNSLCTIYDKMRATEERS